MISLTYILIYIRLCILLRVNRYTEQLRVTFTTSKGKFMMANSDSDNNLTNVNVATSPTAVIEYVAVSIRTLPPPERLLAILALISFGTVTVLAYRGVLIQISPLYVLGFTLLIILSLGFFYFLIQGGVRSEVRVAQAEVHGNWDKAIKIYKDKLVTDKNDKNIKDNLSNAYVQRAKLKTNINSQNIRKSILDDYVPAIEYNPYNFDARIGIAKAYHLLDEINQAIRSYTYAIRLKDEFNINICDKDYIDAFVNRGWAYYDLGHYSQAINDFDKVLQYDPGNGWVYMKRGHAKRAIKKFEEAKDDYIRSVECSPESGAYYENVGKIYLLLENPFEANTWYQRGYEKDKKIINNGWMALWSQLCLGLPKDKHDIAERLRNIAKENPENHMAIPCLGLANWIDKQVIKAQNTLQKFIDDYPGLWDAYFWMSIVDINQDHSDRAMDNLEAALSRGMPPILLSPLQWFTPLPFQRKVSLHYKGLFNGPRSTILPFFTGHRRRHKPSA